jgi:hypothetical protein
MAQHPTAGCDGQTSSSQPPRARASLRGLLKRLAPFNPNSAPQGFERHCCEVLQCPRIANVGTEDPSGRARTTLAELPRHLSAEEAQKIHEVHEHVESPARTSRGAAVPSRIEEHWGPPIHTGPRLPPEGSNIQRYPLSGRDATTRFANNPHGTRLTTILERASPCVSGQHLKIGAAAAHRCPTASIRQLVAQPCPLEGQDKTVVDIDELALHEFRRIWIAPQPLDPRTPSLVANQLGGGHQERQFDSSQLCINNSITLCCSRALESELRYDINLSGHEERLKSFDAACYAYDVPARRSPPLESQGEAETFGLGQGLRKCLISKPPLQHRSEWHHRSRHDSEDSASPDPRGRESGEPVALVGGTLNANCPHRTRIQSSSRATHFFSSNGEEEGSDSFAANRILDFYTQSGPIDLASFGSRPLFGFDSPTFTGASITGPSSSIHDSIQARTLRGSTDQRLPPLKNPTEHRPQKGEARISRDDVYSRYTENGVPIYERSVSLVHNYDGVDSVETPHLRRKLAKNSPPEHARPTSCKLPPGRSSRTCTADRTSTKTITSAALPILLRIAENEGILTKFSLAPQIPTNSTLVKRRKPQSSSLHYLYRAAPRKKLGSIVGSLRCCGSCAETDKGECEGGSVRDFATTNSSSAYVGAPALSKPQITSATKSKFPHACRKFLDPPLGFALSGKAGKLPRINQNQSRRHLIDGIASHRNQGQDLSEV